MDNTKMKVHNDEIILETSKLYSSIYDDKFELPTIPFEILMLEAVYQIQEKLSLTLEDSILTEIKKLDLHLTNNSSCLFRDANPLNTRIPYSDTLNIDPKNAYSKENLLKIESELLNNELAKSNSKFLMNKITQVDLEMLGIKKTTPQDDFVHLTGLLPTNEQYDYAMQKYSLLVSSEELLSYHLTSIFRLTRSSARRLCYHLDQSDNINRYYPFGIMDDFSLLYNRLAISIKYVNDNSSWCFVNFLKFIDTAIFKLENINK